MIEAIRFHDLQLIDSPSNDSVELQNASKELDLVGNDKSARLSVHDDAERIKQSLGASGAPRSVSCMVGLR
jgi:hypothetical protein